MHWLTNECQELTSGRKLTGLLHRTYLMNDLATLQEGPNTNGRRERNHVDVTFAQDTSRCVSNRSISSKLLALSLTSGLLVRTLPCSVSSSSCISEDFNSYDSDLTNEPFDSAGSFSRRNP